MKLLSNSFAGLLLASLLCHLLLAALVLPQRWRVAAPDPRPRPPLTVGTFSRQQLQQLMQHRPVAAPPETRTARPLPANTTVAAKDTSAGKPAAPARPAQQAKRQHSQTKPARTQASHTQVSHTTPPAASDETATAAAKPVNLDAILQHTQRYTAQRPLSAAELHSLTRAPEDSANPWQQQRQSRARAARQTKNADMPADVLEVLADGRQLVKIGDNCALANVGADLRKDIHSIKVIPCGELNRAGSREALFEQIMSGIGQHR